MRARVGAADWTAGKGSLVLPAFSDDLEPDAYYAMMRRVHGGLPQPAARGRHALSALRSSRLGAPAPDYWTTSSARRTSLNEIAWVYHTGGTGAALLQPQGTIPSSFYRKTGRYDFNIEAVLCPAHGAEAETTCAATWTPTARVYRSIRSGWPRLYLLRRRPRAAHGRLGRCQPPATARPAAHGLRHAKSRWRCSTRHRALRLPGGRTGLRPLCGLGHDARGRRARWPPLRGRGHVSRWCRTYCAAAWKARRGSFCARRSWPIDAPCAVEVRRGVGFYHVALADSARAVGDARQLGAGLPARRGNCAWRRRRLRAKEGPGAAPGAGSCPSTMARSACASADVRGKTYYYKLPYEKN